MSSPASVVRADVLATHAYQVADATGLLKLDAMENPMSLPPTLARELADQLTLAPLNRYPEPRPAALESALRAASVANGKSKAKGASIPKGAKLLFGNGSDELIDIIIRTCCLPGEVVMSPVPTFVMYGVYSQWAHAKFVGVDLKDDLTLDMPAMLKAIAQHQPKVVFLAYPNNPTGRSLSAAEVLQIAQACNGLVVVDEAYEPFAAHSMMDQVLQHPNIVVLRTVSKLGLAGVRLGYLAGSDGWVQEFDKVRSPYNVNVLTRIAVEFSLQHAEEFDRQAAVLVNNRGSLTQALRALSGPTRPIEVFDSHANFVLFRVPNAFKVFESLKAKGVLIKYVGKMHALLNDCLRVTVSTEAENRVFLTALEQCLAETCA